MRNSKILSLTQVALCAAFIMVCSYIMIPLPFSPVPVTAQTLAITLTGLMLRPKQAGGAVIVFILIAAVLGKVSFGPSIGYFAGFFASAVVVSLVKGRSVNLFRYMGAALLGIIVTDIPGVIGMMLVLDIPLSTAFVEGVVIFLPGDLCKAVLSVVIAVPLRKALGRTSLLA